MTAGRGQPAFGLSFDPRALTDLLQAPSDIRDLTLAYLQEVVNAQRFGLRLDGDLEGYRKLFVDSAQGLARRLRRPPGARGVRAPDRRSTSSRSGRVRATTSTTRSAAAWGWPAGR